MNDDLFEDDFQGSLNAGSELDDELPQEPQVASPVAALVEELQGIGAMESQLQDLHYLIADIHETGGMHRGFAMEAQRLVPGFAQRAPLGYYTEAPSRTRYQVSLEALHQRVWEMIKAAAKTLVESIQRWIAWFRKTSEASSASPGAVAEEMGARAKVNSETLQETQQSLSELSAATASGQVQSTGADKPRVLPNFDALLAQLLQNSPRYARYEGFFGHATSVHHDIVEGGPYTQAFRAITPTLSGARTLLEQRASVLAQLANAAAQGQSDIQKIVSTRAAMEVAKPLEIRYAGRTCTLHEAADHLARVRQEVQALTPTKRLDLDYVSLAVSDAYAKHDVAAFFYEQGQILVLLAELSTSLTQMQKGMSLSESIKDATSETLGNVLREAVFSLSKDVNGYQQLFAELRQYGQSLERLTQETLNMAQEVDHQLLTHVAKGHLKAPAAWVERAKKMRLRRVQTLFGNA